ncbi:MAG: hypothetical protein ACR2GQ_09055 [Gemmatimonadota bacterium]
MIPDRPAPSRTEPPFTLRSHRAGDMGWVVQRHGEYYFEEHGWDERHEALAARLVSDFIVDFDPARDGCWIAEREGKRVGSVFVIRHDEREGYRLVEEQPYDGLGRDLELTAQTWELTL